MTDSKYPIVAMKNWNKKKRRWDGVVCQVIVDETGKEKVMVYDVMCAEHEIDLEEMLQNSMNTKPWIEN